MTIGENNMNEYQIAKKRIEVSVGESVKMATHLKRDKISARWQNPVLCDND